MRKQIYVGDEEFEEAVQRQIKKTTNRQVRHPLRRIVQAVSEVMGKNEVEIAGRQRSEEIERTRDLQITATQMAGNDRASAGVTDGKFPSDYRRVDQT